MITKSLISSFVLVLSAFTLFPLSKPAARPPRDQITTLKELQQEIESIISEHNVPGTAIALVTRDEQIWIDGIGYSNVEAGTAVTANTIFRWGSVSKSFVSAAIQMVAERGLIHLEDRISDIDPEIEFYNPWQSTHPVRLVHCLEHTSGFDDLRFNECAVDDPNISLSDALAINSNSRHSRWQPGTYKSYSNVGPVVAAHVLETVTGRSFEGFVKDHVFEPLGMETSSFFYPKEADLMATGYGDDGVTPVSYDHIVYRPAGSLNSSPKEMASFVQMLLNRGACNGTPILTPQSVNRMETPTTTLAAQAGSPLGYGLGIYTTMANRRVFHGHDGMIAGFAALYGYNVELDRGFAISINMASDAALKRITQAVIEYLTAGIESPEGQAAAISGKNAASLTGYYQSITPMTQLMHTLIFRFVNVRKVTMKDGALYSGNFLSGKQRELTPLSENDYHRKGSNESLTFIEDGDDKVICYGGLRGNFKKASPLWIFFRLGTFILSLVLMVSSLVFAVIWVPRTLWGNMKGVKYLKARLFPLLAVAFFFATYVSLLIGVMSIEVDKAMMAKLGSLTIYSFAIFISSICFATFSFLGLFFSLRPFFVETSKAVHIHSLLVSVVNVIVTFYLWHEKVIGIRTWLY
jgi:CubicO group peptidase (beta-lactamase class C family)